ncbi:MAG: 16S rRNA (cytidine(1402)-2'-O)-methyltransferase [Polyangiaceae bacterium]
MAGKLFVVATPIGNMGDITLRAIESLRAADLIAAEDTRRARALLTHLGIGSKELARCDEAVRGEALEGILARLEGGATVAFVSDAGTPVIADPGSALVAAARARGIAVVGVPGPSALTALLSVSGLDSRAVRFIGFLPRGDRARAEALAAMRASTDVTVFFEAPHRMAETLRAVGEALGERRVVIGRELTKLYEEVIVGAASEIAAREEAREWLGEIVVAVDGRGEEESAVVGEAEIDRRIAALRAEGRRAKEIAELVALETGWSKRDVYARVIAK